jgi:hypothetical protein
MADIRGNSFYGSAEKIAIHATATARQLFTAEGTLKVGN